MELGGHHNTDEQLQAMLNHLKKEDPDIKCPSGKTVTRLCTGDKCKNALRCSDNRCTHCGREVHLGCLSIQLEDLTEMVNLKLEGCREFMITIFRAEEELIQIIRQKQKEFIETFYKNKLKEYEANAIQSIYKDKNYKALSGQQAKTMCRQLQIKAGLDPEGYKNEIKLFSEQIKKIGTQINQFKEKIFLTDKKKVIEEKMDQSYKIGFGQIKPKEVDQANSHNLKIDSQVLRLKDTMNKDLNYIKEVLNHPKTLKLVFRASQHDFKIDSFHEHCDNVKDTFILLRTEFGKTIGGYSHYKWMNDQKMITEGRRSKSVCDKARRAFLLQLDHQHKLIPAKDDQFLCCSRSGIKFGFKDLKIGDDCNKKLTSHSCPGSLYQNEGIYQYNSWKKECWQIMSGSTETEQFKVIEYEVFQVLWN